MKNGLKRVPLCFYNKIDRLSKNIVTKTGKPIPKTEAMIFYDNILSFNFTAHRKKSKDNKKIYIIKLP